MTDYLISTIFIIGNKSLLTYLLSGFAICFGINTIVSKNPVFSVLSLIGLFAAVSIYLVVVGATFIGISYLLIYIGAISILFIIILMLINVRISELLMDSNNSIFLALFTLLCFNYFVSSQLPSSDYIYNAINLGLFYLTEVTKYIPVFDELTTTSQKLFNTMIDVVDIVRVYSPSWDSALVASSHIITIGVLLYNNLFSLFIMLALILLLAMVGAIIITTNKSSKKTFNTGLMGSPEHM